MAEFVMWLVVAWFAGNALFTVGRVGKPAPYVTAGSAVVAVAFYAVLIVLVLAYWGGGHG